MKILKERPVTLYVVAKETLPQFEEVWDGEPTEYGRVRLPHPEDPALVPTDLFPPTIQGGSRYLIDREALTTDGRVLFRLMTELGLVWVDPDEQRARYAFGYSMRRLV